MLQFISDSGKAAAENKTLTKKISDAIELLMYIIFNTETTSLLH